MLQHLLIILCSIVALILLIYFILIMPNLSRRQALTPFLGLDFAHRGLHDINRLIPENSMRSFQEAVKHNTAIELDIHLTRDNQVVVFHDESLKRICNVEGTIEASTYQELKKLHLSGTDEHIPLFSDVLDYVDGRVPLLIELKLPSKDMRLCMYTQKLLEGYQGPYMIQSFNSLGVRWFFRYAPETLRGQLSGALTRSNPENPYAVRFCVEHLLTNVFCRPDFISYKMADANNLSVFINRHLYHVPIAVWTLRSPKAYRKAHRDFDMYIFEGFPRNN